MTEPSMIGPSVTDALIALATPQRPVPLLLDDDEALRHDDVRIVLRDVAQGLTDIGQGLAERRWIDIAHLGQESRSLLSSMLSVGEISATIAADPPIRIQETALYGVWMVDGKRQGIEVADLPGAVRAAVDQCADRLALPDQGALPEGAMNVLPVLAEIRHHMLGGTANHEINLSLMPISPVDYQLLESVLGTGPVDVLSRGYGSCRIRACAVRNVWRVHYFNVDGQMILDVIQVGDVPAAARATAEDMADQIVRLHDLIAAYFPDQR